jgi:hypothetical protein
MTPARTPRTPELPAHTLAIAKRAHRALGDRRAGIQTDWVRDLTGASIESIGSVVAERGDLLEIEAEIRRRHRGGGRPHYAQIRAPFELYALTRLLRPDHIVETGVSSGVSSAHFLLGLRKNRHGKLHSIDRPTFQRGANFHPRESPVTLPPGEASGWAIPPPLRRDWDLRLGASEALLPALVRELPSVGIFLHDSLHTPAHLTFELETVRPKLVPGAVVLADNTAWTGTAFPRFARRLGVPVEPRGRSDLVGLRAPPRAPPGL